MITQDDKNRLVIHTDFWYEGESLLRLQKALSLGIEELGNNERTGDAEYRNAIWALSYLLRAILLNESQTNVALGGRPYDKSTELVELKTAK